MHGSAITRHFRNHLNEQLAEADQQTDRKGQREVTLRKISIVIIITTALNYDYHCFNFNDNNYLYYHYLLLL